jgi:hypothetical protein
MRNVMWNPVSFGSENPSSKISVSGKRKLVSPALKLETSKCNIAKTIFGKTRDSRIKSPHIYLIYRTRLFLIPKNEVHAKGRKFEGMGVGGGVLKM